MGWVVNEWPGNPYMAGWVGWKGLRAGRDEFGATFKFNKSYLRSHTLYFKVQFNIVLHRFLAATGV